MTAPSPSQPSAALLEYLDGGNHRRLYGEIGMIPRAECETDDYRQNQPLTGAAAQ